MNAQLSARVQTAEAAVRRLVRNRELTQDEFDALVSFTFNMGAAGARNALTAADRGDAAATARHINGSVWIHPRDANGRRLPAVRSNGLVNRRREEAAPFLNQAGGRR